MTEIEIVGFCGIPSIAIICYVFIELIKKTSIGQPQTKKAYPAIAAVLGAFLGIIVYFIEPSLMMDESLFGAILSGIASGLCATGGKEMIKNIKKLFPPDKADPPST